MSTGDRSYPIYIGSGLLRASLLRQHVPGDTVLIVTNETIGPLYLNRSAIRHLPYRITPSASCIKALLDEDPELKIESVALPDGEQYKSVEVLDAVWRKALEKNHSR